MTVLWTDAAAAAATGGTATASFRATGVSIDSREIAAGDLFVALTSARDGHDFVADAFDAGAAAALVTHRPANVPAGAPLLIVEDVKAGLEALGKAARARTRARVVAVTGSAGKTSTKKMLADALAGQGRVHAAARSFNNHWGVPLTLARMPADADFAVIEIGMNAPGEIAPLSRMARPDVALVTLVAAAHLEAFGALEGIAHEKASIFEGLQPGGTAIFNADLETSDILEAAARRHAAHIVSFGEAEGHDWRLARTEVSAGGLLAEITGPRGRHTVSLGTPGHHFAQNAVAVLAVLSAVDADVARGADALRGWVPPGGRGAARPVALAGGGTAWLVDDAFNANPASVAAALRMTAALVPQANGRRVAILGDMLELGPEETALHAAIAQDPSVAAFGRVHCVGPRMRHLHEALDDAKRGEWAADAAQMAQRLPRLVGDGDIVLIKGSKGSRVSRLVEALHGTEPALET